MRHSFWKKFLVFLSATGLLLSSGQLFAAKLINESFVNVDSSKVEFWGVLEGEQNGSSVLSADLNADGVDDLIIGAPFASKGLKTWNGAVYVVWGAGNFADKKAVNLGSLNATLVVYGKDSGDQLGSSLEKGDFNNDGIDDLAIGAFNAGFEGERRGKVYVLFGKEHFKPKSIHFDKSKADLELIGREAGDLFGLSLKSMDINDDGIDDLLVGAPNASSAHVENSGMVYAYLGGARRFGYKMHNLSESLADVSFYGQESGERFGSDIDGGMISRSNSKDVVISAYKSDVNGLSNAGRLYLFKTGKLMQRTKKPNAYIEGQKENEWFGFALEVADLDNNNVDDVVASSFPYQGEASEGTISIIPGGSFLQEEGIRVSNEGYFRKSVIKSAPKGLNLGASLQLLDLDGDSYKEIVAGAPGIGRLSSEEAGRAYVIASERGEFSPEYHLDLLGFDTVIHGENADDWFAYSMGSGDFNDDGMLDLVFGSRYSEVMDTVNTGKTFVLMGDSKGFGEAKLVDEPGDALVSRGELVRKIVDDFDLRDRRADFIKNCYEFKEFCFFNFAAQSSFEGISLNDSVQLYPDVPNDDPFYEVVNIATALGLVNGYLNEPESPFHSDWSVSRIQALKVVLSANDLVKPMHKFELVDELGSYDALRLQGSYFSDIDARWNHMWWYPRYVNFAVQEGIIDDAGLFRPDDYITAAELEDMIQRTLNLISFNEESLASGDTIEQTVAGDGEEDEA